MIIALSEDKMYGLHRSERIIIKVRSLFGDDNVYALEALNEQRMFTVRFEGMGASHISPDSSASDRSFDSTGYLIPQGKSSKKVTKLGFTFDITGYDSMLATPKRLS